MRQRVAAVCGLAAVAFAVATPIIGGAVRPGYSHVAQFISELGESGSANGPLVSAAGFAPTGILVFLFLAFATPSFPACKTSLIGALLFGAVAIAYVVSAIARCDAGCPADGSLSQSVHNTFGLLEYVGACSGLVLLRRAFRQSATWRSLAPLCAICAVLIGVGLAAMLAPSLSPMRGVSQRVAEVGVFSWIVGVSMALLREHVA